MELKQIKELMTVMSRTGTKKLKIKEGDFELTLERPDNSSSNSESSETSHFNNERYFNHMYNRADQTLLRSSEHSLQRMPNAIAYDQPKQDEQSLFITSPMVGTFYAAPSPSDPPFIKVGDRVEKETVVCIIEAMKVMNEVKANQSGVIAEILFEAGQPVEFGAKLFKVVEPS